MKKTFKIIFIMLIVLLVVLQFYRIDKTNPPEDASIAFIATVQPPAEIANLLKTSCFDCHSHNTTYPWYSNVSPLSLLLRSHIRGARKHLNFSTWGNYTEEEKEDLMKEAAEEIEDGNMPMKSYLFMHSDAKLSDDQRQLLINWLKNARTGS